MKTEVCCEEEAVVYRREAEDRRATYYAEISESAGDRLRPWSTLYFRGWTRRLYVSVYTQ
jgi:hypothetical protein